MYDQNVNIESGACKNDKTGQAPVLNDITNCGNSLKLPAFNSAAVKHFVCCFVNFIRLISLDEFLHVLGVFVIFTRYDQVYGMGVFYLRQRYRLRWSQANLAGIGGIDNCQSDFARRPEIEAAAVLPAQQFSDFLGSQQHQERSAAGQRHLSVLIKPTFLQHSSSERPRLSWIVWHGNLRSHPAVHPVI